MHNVFLSYTERDYEDKGIADKINSQLNSANVSTWFAPERIIGGSDYREYIKPNVCNANIIVIIVSHASLSSREVIIELDTAYKNSKVIIPFLVPSFQFEDLSKSADLISQHNLSNALSSKQLIDSKKDTLNTDIKYLVDMILAIESNQEMQSQNSKYSESSKIETIKTFIIEGNFLKAKLILDEYNSHVNDKDFFLLASIIIDLSLQPIRRISMKEHNEHVLNLKKIIDNQNYANIASYVLSSIIICYYQNALIASPLGSATDFVNFLKTKPKLILAERKLVKNLQLCEDFSIKYRKLFS